MKRFIRCLCILIVFSTSLGIPNQIKAQVRQELTTSRLYLPLSSNLTAIKEGESVSLITKDYLSSTRSITIDNKQLTFGYYPYGSSVLNSNGLPAGRQGQILDSKTDKLFTGHRKLDGVSVYHAGARYYSPTLGQFIQPDPVEGPNRYAYTANNPITFNDPTGNCVQCDVWWMRQYVTGDHPWQAQSFSTNPSLATLGHIDTWSGGIPSLLVGLDMQDNALDTMLSDSKQYVSKSEAEAAFMVNMGVLAVSGAQGVAGVGKVGVEGIQAPLLGEFGPSLSKGKFGAVYGTSDDIVTKIFFDTPSRIGGKPFPHEAEQLPYQIQMLRENGSQVGGLFPGFEGEVYGAQGDLVGYRMQRIYGTSLRDYTDNPLRRIFGINIPDELIEGTTSQLAKLNSAGLRHNDLHGNNILLQTRRGFPRGRVTGIHIIDPYYNPGRVGDEAEHLGDLLRRARTGSLKSTVKDLSTVFRGQ